jgi:PAS domain S-box-containing protein
MAVATGRWKTVLNELQILRRRISELEKYKRKYKNIENSLRQSDERFFKLFHFCLNPLAITTIQEGWVLDINEAFSRIFGYARCELVGHRMSECGIWVIPEQRDLFLRKLQGEGIVTSIEADMRSKSGEMHTILLSAETLPVNDEMCLLSMGIL